MQLTLFKNSHIVDGTSAEKSDLVDVIIENDRIKEVGPDLISSSAEVIDLKGCTLMPGLIDCHVHVTAALADLGANGRLDRPIPVDKHSGTVIEIHALVLEKENKKDADKVRSLVDGYIIGEITKGEKDVKL